MPARGAWGVADGHRRLACVHEVTREGSAVRRCSGGRLQTCALGVVKQLRSLSADMRLG